MITPGDWQPPSPLAMDSTAHPTLPNTQSCPRVIVHEQRMLVHLALAELNTEHQDGSGESLAILL